MATVVAGPALGTNPPAPSIGFPRSLPNKNEEDPARLSFGSGAGTGTGKALTLTFSRDLGIVEALLFPHSAAAAQARFVAVQSGANTVDIYCQGGLTDGQAAGVYVLDLLLLGV